MASRIGVVKAVVSVWICAAIAVFGLFILVPLGMRGSERRAPDLQEWGRLAVPQTLAALPIGSGDDAR